MAANLAEPPNLPTCDATGSGIQTVTGAGAFTVCSGTPGNLRASGRIPNDEDPPVRAYQNFFNSTTAQAGCRSPCINTFTPSQSTTDPYTFIVAPDATEPHVNETAYATAMGCCTRLSDYTKQITAAGLPTVPPQPNDRITRLNRFSTDSFDGAVRNYGGTLAAAKGVPPDLWGMTKIWGVSPKPPNTGGWLHGGVHAANVGAWNAGKDGFTINCGGKKWTQQYVLWCRMTGDNYNPNNDPYGATGLCPAPNGSYITDKPMSGPKQPFLNAIDSNAGEGLHNPCEGCETAAVNGQIYVNPQAKIPSSLDTTKAPTQWNGGVGTTCMSPYYQACNMGELSDEICKMPDCSAIVASGVTGWGYQDSTVGGCTGYTAKSRVGGCFTTRDMYGPGTFSVVVNLPPTLVLSTDAIAEENYPVPSTESGGLNYGGNASGSVGMSGGRGYVFSMWTFSYAEAYGVPSPKSSPTDSLTVSAPYDATPGDGSGSSSTLIQYVDATNTMVQGMQAVPVIPGIRSGSLDTGFMTVHNAEIDIEIPSNSGQVAAPGFANQKQYSGLDTANFNTWVTDTDTDSYAAGTATLYQQAQATSTGSPKQFFASVGPDDDENTYHNFSFVWYVDPAQETMPTDATASTSYVAFYRDDVEIFKCHRFVPRRSGRVVIGMWPAWWGSIRKPMAYNQVYCKIARLEFTPQCDYSGTPFVKGALVTNAPQTYDQVIPMADGSYNEIKCGFDKPITYRAAVPYPATAQFCKTPVNTMAAALRTSGGALGGVRHSPTKWQPPSPFREMYNNMHAIVQGSKSKYPTWALPVAISVGSLIVLALIVSIIVILWRHKRAAGSAFSPVRK